MAIIDETNRRMGNHKLFFGAEGTLKAWAMKRNRMTKAFTTRWSELPEVSSIFLSIFHLRNWIT